MQKKIIINWLIENNILDLTNLKKVLSVKF